MKYEVNIYGINKERDEQRTFSQPGTAIEWADYMWETSAIFQVDVCSIEPDAYGDEPIRELIWQRVKALI